MCSLQYELAVEQLWSSSVEPGCRDVSVCVVCAGWAVGLGLELGMAYWAGGGCVVGAGVG
eukprot:scaffold3331_cov69-Phaeocystis_antarctica.AAC.1